MHVQVKMVLRCSPDAAWDAVRSPSRFRRVSRPFLFFRSLEAGGFPTSWPVGDHRVRVRGPLALFPLGEQTISISYSEHAGIRIMQDAGCATSGILTTITRWRHRIAIAPTADGRTLYRDRLDFSAGPLTPLVWLGLWAFWQWRSVGLRRIR
jgi:hypothetical protein